MIDCKQKLLEKILLCLSKYDLDLQEIDLRLSNILYEYNITKKEESLVPYSESKNEVYLKRFILSKAISGCTERTLKHYEEEIRRSLVWLGKDINDICSNDIKNLFAVKLTNGNSKSYVDTIRRYLNSFFNYLTKEELILQNPMNKVDKIKFHKEKEEAFTDLEIEQMRAVCQNSMETAIIEMLLSTGCRAAELVSIKIADIKGDTIEILGKGEKYRNVYLNARCQVALKMYLKDRKDKNVYLFPGGMFVTNNKKMRSVKGEWYKHSDCVSDSEHYGRESVNTICRKIANRAKVDNAHAHRFRRTCATMALRRGMPIELVSKMLGHESLQTTQIYLDLKENDLKIAHEKYVY